MSDMVIFGSVHVVAAATLQQLNHVVAQWESNVGPLVTMQIDNAETLLRFKAQADRPDTPSVIAEQTAGTPQIPTGAVLVTTGQVFVTGAPTLCAATRG
jgi:peptidyl-tRNA hydrolase